MKKFLIIGTLGLLLGITLMIAGMSMLDWKFVDLDSEEYTKYEYVFDGEADNIAEIRAKLDLGRVKVIRGQDVKIVYYEGSREKTDINFSDGSLKFTQTYKNFASFFTGFRGMKKALYFTEIHIPEELTVSLNIETRDSEIQATATGNYTDMRLKTTNSKISVSNIKTVGAINLESTNGKISLTECSASSVKLKTTNDEINLKNIECSELEVQTTNGDIIVGGITAVWEISLKTTNDKISLTDCSASGVTVRTTNGKVIIKDTECTALDARSTNGDISAENIKSAKKLKLVTTNSDIYINRIESSDIHLSTTNSKITGNIKGERGDYSIDSSTTNSSNNLGKNTSSSDKKLYVRTTNGKIDIDFAND